MRIPLFVLAWVSVLSLWGQSFQLIEARPESRGDSTHIFIACEGDLLGRGRLIFRVENRDSSQLKADFFEEGLWIKYLDGKLAWLLSPPAKTPTRYIYQKGRYRKEFSYSLTQLQLQRLQRVPIEGIFRREMQEGEVFRDSLNLNDPWILANPKVLGKKYWEGRDKN